MQLNFKNKNVLITGAGRGLGYDLVKKYLDLGAKVISVSRSDFKLDHNNHIQIKLNLQKTNSVKILEKIN